MLMARNLWARSPPYINRTSEMALVTNHAAVMSCSKAAFKVLDYRVGLVSFH